MYGIVQQAVAPLPFRSEMGMFMIYLPVASKADAPPGDTSPSLAGAGPFSSLKVNQPSALIAKMLHDTGYAVLEASQDFEASQTIEIWLDHPDLILTDVVMP